MSVLIRRRFWSFFEALYSQELSNTAEKAPQPPTIGTPLLPHQLAILAAARRLERSKTEGIDVEALPGEPTGGKLFTSHGILADSVGSGKSLIALSLVNDPPPSTNYTELSIRNGHSIGDGRDVCLLRQRSQIVQNVTGITLSPVRTCLFIIPHALISQWETYVAKDTSLRAKFIKKKQDATADDFMTTITDYDAIFVSSTMYPTLRSANPIHTILWKRLFIDEADSINISTIHDELNAMFYWFISASWLNLIFAGGACLNVETGYTPLPETPQHVIDRVRSLMCGSFYLQLPGVKHNNIVRRMCGHMNREGIYTLAPSNYQSARLMLRCSPDFLAQSFTPAPITHTEIICKTPQNIQILGGQISNEMMEHLNAGDISGALTALGMTTHSEAQIIDAVSDSIRKELGAAERVYEFKKTIEYSSDASKQKALETCEQKIAGLQARLTAIEERIRSAKTQTCPICYCDISGAAVVPCCQQVFCFSCLCQSLRRVAACPLCRARIDAVSDVRVVGLTAVEKDLSGAIQVPPQRATKQEAFLQFLLDHPDARILMFSSYDATFGHVERQLGSRGIRYTNLNGSQARINKILAEFKAGAYQVLFLNARNMGAGLNIDTATHVVLYHKMSAELTNQIVGRANRLGRSAPLNVVHLLHNNEMSDRISHS